MSQPIDLSSVPVEPLLPHRHKRTPSKPQTPTSGPSTLPKPRSSVSETRRSKQTFTTCRSFPQALPIFQQPIEASGDLPRNARRSKVEAISKIDRAGTPLNPNAGPAATSFLPARAPSAGPSIPHSSRNPLLRPATVNPPFDISTVRTTSPRHAPSRSDTRLWGLEECPVFHPTPLEFSDPMAYITSIGPIAKPYGICKIVPPEGWRMPFVLETETFRFRTRLQKLNQLDAAKRAKLNYLEQLTLFHLQQGDAKVTIPVIERQPLDVWRLRKEVTKMRGHEEVTKTNSWGTLAQTLGYGPEHGMQIKNAYMRIIYPFENFTMRAKSNSGSPLTPMPSTTASRPPGFVNESPGSPTRVGRMTGMRAVPAKDRMSGGGVGANGPLTNQALAGVAVQAVQGVMAEEDARSGSGGPKIKVPGFESMDGSESDLSDDEAMSSKGRRRSTPQPVPYQKGEVCEVCRGGHAAEKILLCDGCDRGFHIYCLDPPLSAVPTNEEWYCTPCLLSKGDDFGFEEGEDHSIPSFQARDAGFAAAWWDIHRPPLKGPKDPKEPKEQAKPRSRALGRAAVSEDDVEREFWRLTESSTDTVEVEYGADVHSTTHGSGAPTLETHPLNPYAKDGWNLNNMPILPESLLRYIKSDISGMTVPWIYLGMLFSTFCWHNEDHYTYSVNYMYWGETKTWYGIPGSDAEKFENAIKSEAPELFEQQPSLLYQLVTMMNPGKLKESGVNVVACDQRPNEFVITYPKAYHCGFNHGINFNEAVNFALPDWLAEGKECVTRYKLHKKAPVFSHNELLVTITLYSETIKTAIWLLDSLRVMVAEETTRRDQLRSSVPLLTEVLVEEDCPEEQYQCCICRGFCYLSQITCTCTKLVACIEHADQLCPCPKTKRTLKKRYSEAQLDEILSSVEARAYQPEHWRERLEGLMEVPKPALKSMRSLLSDGERIAHKMEEVDDLREMVGRASSWVERIAGLFMRKTTGRRRKGKEEVVEEEQERSPELIYGLLKEAEKLAFDAPEIKELRHTLLNIESFKNEAASILSAPREADLNLEKCETTLILGNSLNIDMPEIALVQAVVNRLEWFRKVEEEVDDRTIQYHEVLALLREAEEFDIPGDNEMVVELGVLGEKGKEWAERVERLMKAKVAHVDEISELVEGQELVPTNNDLMRQLEGVRKTVYNWQISAKSQLDGQGTVTGSTRLCKAVKSATGLAGRVDIPEITKLQGELDIHGQWQKELADVLGVAPGKLGATLTTYLSTMRYNLAKDDWEPNDRHACVCRGSAVAPMIPCGICHALFHPRCVGIPVKNIDKPFECLVCTRGIPDDRPSLDTIAGFTDTHKWNFRFKPAELVTLNTLIHIAVPFAKLLLKAVDPFSQAPVRRNVELLRHYARKLFSLPMAYDARNTISNERIVFEDWVDRRIYDALNAEVAVVAPPTKSKGRVKKGRLLLEGVGEKSFKCLCGKESGEIEDRFITCMRCLQAFHAGCVRAPNVYVEGKPWRCVFCTVREGKHYYDDVEVVVQRSERLGSEWYVDYRQTINDNSMEIIEMRLPQAVNRQPIRLQCTGFIPPVFPKTVCGEEGEDGHKAKKRKVEMPVDSRPVNLIGSVAGVHPTASAPRANGHSHSQAIGHANGYAHTNGHNHAGTLVPPQPRHIPQHPPPPIQSHASQPHTHGAPSNILPPRPVAQQLPPPLQSQGSDPHPHRHLPPTPHTSIMYSRPPTTLAQATEAVRNFVRPTSSWRPGGSVNGNASGGASRQGGVIDLTGAQ